MTGHVRPAAEADVDAIVELAEVERATQHANRGSAIWRRAPGSAEVIRTNTLAGFTQPHMMLLVHESEGSVDGYLVAAMIESEPFFDPGGQVCFITDFVLRDPDAWPMAGAALLAEATAACARRGAVAAVAQCAAYDDGKRALLEAQDFGPGWDYRTRDLGPVRELDRRQDASGVRPATPADADAIVALVDRDFTTRHTLRSSSVWRKAADSSARYRAEVAELLAQDHVLLRVHESAGAVDGYIRAMLVDGPPVWDPGGKVCFVTEFVLGDPTVWRTTGLALLTSATTDAARRSAVAALVQYGHYDAGKQVMLIDLEYAPVWGYRTRDL